MGARQTGRLVAMTDTLLRDAARQASAASHEAMLRASADMVHAATHDMLTGLPTRGVPLANLARRRRRRGANRRAVNRP